MTYALHADSGKLGSLATDQFSYHGMLQGIVSEIRSVATSTRSGWDGAGNPEFGSSSDEFDAHAAEVLASFSRLAGKTDEAGSTWSSACRTIRAGFGA